MSTSKPTAVPSRRKRRRGSGPVSFFVALFFVALGSIQLVSTFHSYALNLAELNGLKRQEASLIERKRDLEDDIARWNDAAYVTAQARERLGFVFPGEQAVRVEHPEAVTGGQEDDARHDEATNRSTLPWYSELAYALNRADEGGAQGESEVQSPSQGTGGRDGVGNGQ